jgi:regulatory protein
VALLTDIRSRRGSRRRQLYLDDQEWRAVSADVVRELGLRVGHIESLDDLSTHIDAAEPRLARDRALRLLTYRDRSVDDLSCRLSDDGYPSETATRVVGDLVRVGLVDDARFAASTARVLATIRGFGRLRILRELDAHGIDPEMAAAAVSEALPEELELESALRLARAMAARPGADVSRVAARLARKGFAVALSLRAARQVLGESRVDDGSDLPVLDD